MTLDDPIARAEAAALALRRRRARIVKVHSRLKDLNATLSPKQTAYVMSRAARRRLLGSRQSGKSRCIVVGNINGGFESKCDSLYVAPTSKSARNAVWSKLHAINTEYEFGIELREGAFSAVFPTGSTWDFEGAHDSARVQRLRGKTVTGELTVDEGGFYANRLIVELLGPVALAMFLTTRQRITVASSPALLRRGRFFELGMSEAWEQHKLTAYDNPAIKDVQQALKDLRDASAWTETTPAYLREGLGEEVDDATNSVYELTDINIIDELPEGPFECILTLDFGDSDQSALAIVGWREHDSALYVMHVEGASHLDIEDVAQRAKKLIQRYAPRGIYADTGGGGAQHVAYLKKRHKLPVQPVAKKQNYKKAAIDQLNADMRRGDYKVPRHLAELIEQMQALQVDPNALAKGEWAEHPSMPNDLCDVAGVYGHMHSRHYRAEPKPPPKPEPGTAEAWQQYVNEGLRHAMATAQQHHSDIEAAEEERAYLTGADL